MRLGPAGSLWVALFVPSVLLAAGWGDYRHEYLLPEERDDPLQVYSFAGMGWRWAEEEREEGGTEWRGDLWDGSSAGLWAAGSLAGRIAYFAEGAFRLEEEKGRAGPVRIDGRIWGEALHLRGGRFFLPVGLEGRSAPVRENRFVSRPWVRVPLVEGAATYGALFEQRLNFYVALGESFAREMADSLVGPFHPAGEDEGEEPLTYAGRLALSPRRGFEVAFSRSADAESNGERGRTDLFGFDLSLLDGPLLLQAEWVRFRLDERTGGERRVDGAYGRLAYRLIEYSRRWEAVEILLGFDYLDPSGEQSNDRLTNYIVGLALAPRDWGALKGEFRTAREEGGGRTDAVLVEFLLRY